MPSVKALKEQAAELDIDGRSKMSKAELEAAIAAATGAPQDAQSEAQSEEQAPEAAEEDRPLPGVPTEPERGGLSRAEMAAFAPAPGPTAETALPPVGPSITGSYNKELGVGIPTEPERGGLTDAERRLHGA